MAIVQRSVQIKASPQETMALLSDARRWPDWYPGMTEIDIAAPFPAEGGKVAFKVKSAGMSMSIAETVIDYQPGKLQLLQMDGMLSGRARWELTPEGDRTRLTRVGELSQHCASRRRDESPRHRPRSGDRRAMTRSARTTTGPRPISSRPGSTAISSASNLECVV
jgi:carbon monoxide dehydrogenase subunit G